MTDSEGLYSQKQEHLPATAERRSKVNSDKAAIEDRDIQRLIKDNLISESFCSESFIWKVN